MTKYEVVPATEEHAKVIAPQMRQVDIDELWASWHVLPLDGILQSMRGSRDPKVGLADGVPACIFGVAERSILSGVGYPWLMATPEIKNHALRFLRMTKEYMQGVKRRYSLLENYGDARNTEAFKWMEWLGFEILPAEPYGIEQLPFRKFTMAGEG